MEEGIKIIIVVDLHVVGDVDLYHFIDCIYFSIVCKKCGAVSFLFECYSFVLLCK